jgi:hypothetical protein
VTFKTSPPICATPVALTAPPLNANDVAHLVNITEKAAVTFDSVMLDCLNGRPGISANTSKLLTLKRVVVQNCISRACPVPRPIPGTSTGSGNSTAKSNTTATACGGGLTLLSASVAMDVVAFKNNSAYYSKRADDPPEVEEGEGWGGAVFIAAGALPTPPGKAQKWYSGAVLRGTTVALIGAPRAGLGRAAGDHPGLARMRTWQIEMMARQLMQGCSGCCEPLWQGHTLPHAITYACRQQGHCGRGALHLKNHVRERCLAQLLPQCRRACCHGSLASACCFSAGRWPALDGLRQQRPPPVPAPADPSAHVHAGHPLACHRSPPRSPNGVTVSFSKSAIRNNKGPNCTAIASVRYDQKGVLKLLPGAPLTLKLGSGAGKATAFTGALAGGLMGAPWYCLSPPSGASEPAVTCCSAAVRCAASRSPSTPQPLLSKGSPQLTARGPACSRPLQAT